MTLVSTRVHTFLKSHSVPFQVIHHRRDYSSQFTAAHTHTPGQEFAKTVVLWIDGHFAMAVLPAHHEANFKKLGVALKAKVIKLASEHDMETLFSDCELGAVPPFGNLYDMPVYVSQAMKDNAHITFNAGSHEDAIRMSFEEFERLVSPRILDFSDPD